jgi:hypothetical protein
LEVEQVEPLSFLLKPAIHRENLKLIEDEQNIYRALSWRERWRLRRYVRQLAGELRAWNSLTTERDKLARECIALKAAHDQATDDGEKAKLAAAGRKRLARGREVERRLDSLTEAHKRYEHYHGWLKYEGEHRRELIQRAKDEKRIRRGMDKEAKWLQTLIIDVFKKTRGCHFMETDGKGNRKARAPEFFKVQTGPDAHYFWLAASKKTLFGWRWLLPHEVTVDRLQEDEVISNLKAATRRDVAVQWTEQGQIIFRVSRLDSPDALPRLVHWRDTRQFFPETRREYLPYCIGVAEKRKFEWFNFGDDPHLLVAGKSQSGKSNLVNGIIATLVQTHSPDELRIVLVDQKGGIEFTHWTEIPHLLWNVAKTVDEVKPMLDRVVTVMKKRMALLERAKKKDLPSYNRSTDERLPRILVVIDEMNTFVGLGALTEEIHNLIMLIVSQGRAVGIHMIAATQHPEVKVIPGRIKTNMSVRMSGAMPSIVASQIVLDSADAAKIPNIPGRFVAVVGLRTLTVQVPRIEDGDIAHVVSKAQNDYPETSDELKELSNAPKLKVWDETAVIQAALDWTQGSLSGQKIHKLLGSESPGERQLNTLCKRVIDAAAANGGTIEHAGEDYTVQKNTRAKGYVIRRSDGSDGFDMGVIPSSLVGTASEPSQPLEESAAD